MWAYLGLLSLGALLWWQIHFRWAGRWKGNDLLAPGADARVRALFVKNKDTLIAIGVWVRGSDPLALRTQT
jgi:hypothetical protein